MEVRNGQMEEPARKTGINFTFDGDFKIGWYKTTWIGETPVGPRIPCYSRPRGHPKRLRFPFGCEEPSSKYRIWLQTFFDRVENQAPANRPPAGLLSMTLQREKPSRWRNRCYCSGVYDDWGDWTFEKWLRKVGILGSCCKVVCFLLFVQLSSLKLTRDKCNLKYICYAIYSPVSAFCAIVYYMQNQSRDTIDLTGCTCHDKRFIKKKRAQLYGVL